MARRRDDRFEDNPLTFSERQIEQDVQSNPLAFGRPGFYEQYREEPETPVLEGISPEIAAANPLLTPPRPIKYMPVEQQIIWQEMQAEALNNQALLQARLNDNKKAATEAKLEVQRRAQSSAIFDGLNDLDPTSDDYEEKRDSLLISNPVGAVTEEVKGLFAYKDAAWKLRQDKVNDRAKRVLDTEEAVRKDAILQAKKDAAEIGDPVLIDRVSKLAADNPDAAIAHVRAAKNQITQANLHTQLRQYGVPEEEIAQKYPNALFADAALARVKVEEQKRVAAEKPASEAQTADILATLSKQKADLELYGKPVPPEVENALKYYQTRLGVFATEPGRTAAPPTTANVPTPGRPTVREGTQATGSKGEKLIWKNGQWNPL